ncbi:U-box domain-containing protein 35 isoform X2 [Selaginella moellendorffii]|uniref:U-box domain-containing protein 35 isoform X2 n=1 Tax=Selaginella moellendorffii TaxID=88036 RepID=UPI000D1CBB55|nr:U-box domain-containing protein 35 isoform X2 [Selaginella moellendorffii]|eukprot:XP_024518650.1 U-box domain-containing protein 35 isoform X2 [Selaginella moellendorffii]
MEIEEIEGMEVDYGVPLHKTGVALVPDARSGVVLKWTLENAVERNGELLLFHVRSVVRTITTPVGRVPVSQVSKEKLAAYMATKEAKTADFSQELQNVCRRYEVKAEFVLVESDDVGKSLVEQIEKYQVTTFVLGESRTNLLRLRSGVSDYVRKHAPDYCTVQCISKSSKLASFRNASPPHSFPRTNSSPARPSVADKFIFPLSPSPSSSWLEADALNREILMVSTSPLKSHLSMRSSDSKDEIAEGSYQPQTPELKVVPPAFRTEEEFAESSPSSIISEPLPADPKAGDLEQINMLKQQLQNAIVAANKAKESADAETLRSQEARENADWALKRVNWRCYRQKSYDFMAFQAEILMRAVEEDNQREYNAAKKLDEESQKRAEALTLVNSMKKALVDEIRRRKEMENRIELQCKAEAEREANRQQLLKYTQFTFEELRDITDNFSENNKIGEGSYGHVYKGTLHRTNVAVKVLRHDSWQGPQEFEQEVRKLTRISKISNKHGKIKVEVLSRLHHPHIVLLLGGNPEKKCLVYEYLENGSLEDRLFCKDDSPPISCLTRYQIAVEVGTALLFLHKAKPQPIVLRDLKPSNILLDKNYNSKISDVGLARFMPGDATSVRSTSPVGTFAYIDPEYQREGSFNAKSDVFAFGIILLQLLTATSPVGIIHKVSTAVDQGHLMEILDTSAGEWPLAAATQLACIGLNCAEVQRKNRPELENVLQMLETMNHLFRSEERPKSAAPTLFLCPILQEVMEYPVIASDGYTYEYDAIIRWLQKSDASPMTNLRLENKNLTPNRVVRSAICEWRAPKLP